MALVFKVLPVYNAVNILLHLLYITVRVHFGLRAKTIKETKDHREALDSSRDSSDSEDEQAEEFL